MDKWRKNSQNQCKNLIIVQKIGFVLILNDFTNLRDEELSLLIKLKYDKYIEYCKHGEMCVLCNKPKVD